MNIISGVVEHLRGLVFHWGGIKQAAFFSHSVFLSASLFLTSLLARSPAILSTFRVQRGGRKLAAYFTPPFLFVVFIAIIALQLFFARIFTGSSSLKLPDANASSGRGSLNLSILLNTTVALGLFGLHTSASRVHQCRPHLILQRYPKLI